ncbi:MAG: hypothetical protein CMQ43_08745 [Gammaproteobacteria bacterium]|nr:hypothetical protein [Gammaproteobacteria bacterium]
MSRAVSLALAADDPNLARLEAEAQALEATAVADGQLPDPVISTQVANVPTDTFALDQADMTQLRLGVRQEFPPGRSRAVKTAMRRSEADARRAERDLERRRIVLETRMAWLDLAWHTRAVAIVERSIERVGQQIDSLSARFASGRLNAQDVLRSELELTLLEDRLAEHQRRGQTARADLARYIGPEAAAPLPDAWPDQPVPAPLERLIEALPDHPAVLARSARIDAADAGVELAGEAYKPTWALEGGYGIRQDRPDFATVGVTVSLPLFTDKRQDRRHVAAVRQRSAAHLERDAVLLEMRRRLERAWADWQRYDQRRRLYAEAVQARARQTAEASVATYANGRTDFAELVRSQLAELDADLARQELEARVRQALAELDYLSGSVDPTAAAAATTGDAS